MASKTPAVSVKDLANLKEDIALIENILMNEGELAEWTKRQIDVACDTPESQCTSHEEVGEMLGGL